MPETPDAAELIDFLLARCTFPPAGTAVSCAFSGGADSTALVVLATKAGCDVAAVHVDHGLRESSRSEADRAEAMADAIGVPFRRIAVAVEPGPNLEARAREARCAALPPGSLTGHTSDDQAETVLINLIRGAGVDGLAGMAPGPTKPLLALRRAETVALCRALELDVVDDPSNADRRFVRNRVRAEVIPLLNDVAGRDVVPLLVRSADVIRDDAALLDIAASAVDPTDAKALSAVDPALARRALRRWLTRDGYPPDLATTRRALDVAKGIHRACDLDDGYRLERHRQRLSIVPPGGVASSGGMGRRIHSNDGPEPAQDPT